MFPQIKNIVQKSSFYFCNICMFVLIPMMLLTSFDVLARFFFNNPVSGSVEISSYFMAILILTGLAYTHQVKGQIFVELLVKRLPYFFQHSLNIFTGLLSLFIIVLLTWQGWLEAVNEQGVSDMLRIPQWPFEMLVPVAGFLLSLEILMDIFDSIAGLLKKDT